jgi:peptidoglycan/LPS O-acetylase OafA/YrhL
MKEVHNLDLLRASAVLFVLFDHTALYVGIRSIGALDMEWLGRLGVLFFFVHTCCVLMMSLERHRGKGFFAHFYLRRIFRIYPLAVAAVLATMVHDIGRLNAWGWAANFLLVQNLTYSNNAFTALWSLPLEVQMYVLLPFCFLLARRLKSVWPLLALWCSSVALAFLQPHITGRASLLRFIPCFLPGVISYVLFIRNTAKLPAWLWPVTIATLTVGFEMYPNWEWSAWLVCLALGLTMPLFRQISNTNINAVALNVAKYSFGIYLSHTLLLAGMRPTFKTLPLYLLAVAVVSVATYRLIEQPMISLGNRMLRPATARKLTEEKLAKV